VQDVDPAVQEAIGRVQPLSAVRQVVEDARKVGFDSLNLDLIYGLPRQTLDGLRATIAEVVALGPDRLAVFGYAHVPSMRPHQKQIDAAALPTGYAKFQLFERAVRDFEGSGYQWIGLDHFARAEDDLAMAAREHRLHRNFMGYTVQPADHLLAFGMSGIGDLAGRFVQLDAKLGSYQRTVDAGRLPVTRGHRLSEDDLRRRSAIMHLMCNLELPFDLALEGGGTPTECFGQDLERFRPHVEAGLAVLDPDRLRVTDTGRFFLRNLCMELDAHLERSRQRAVFSRTV
jgi:oxygen-independent coproporphyrinogen-3 oxidase